MTSFLAGKLSDMLKILILRDLKGVHYSENYSYRRLAYRQDSK